MGAKDCIKAANRAAAAKPPRPLPECDLSKGITTDERTGSVTFHLTEPTPEFVYQLTLSIAVPEDTPVDLKPGQFLPATGPYKVDSYVPKVDATRGRPATHGRLELVRNPRFREWSPAAQPAGYPDRIVLQTGYPAAEAAARVADGRADLFWEGSIPPATLGKISARKTLQLHSYAGQYTNFVFLNVSKPPFDNLQARRAVAFGLNRAQLLTEGFPGPSTCQLIPPAFGGYRPYCPFTRGDRASGQWTGPDLETAQDLVKRSGTLGAKVVLADPVFGDPPDTTRRITKDVVRLLERLGYDASFRSHPDQDFYRVVQGRHSLFNGGIQAWGADYPAGSNYVASVGQCQGISNLSGFCERALDQRIAAALAQQVTEPGSANDTWAALDREVVDAAATIPYGNSVRQDFVSQRVGNLRLSPITGPVMSQMWVQ